VNKYKDESADMHCKMYLKSSGIASHIILFWSYENVNYLPHISVWNVLRNGYILEVIGLN
jgi:hypothetical protein